MADCLLDARNHEVAFIVMMAGSGVPGDQILVAQSTLMAEAECQNHEVALKTGDRERELLVLLKLRSGRCCFTEIS